MMARSRVLLVLFLAFALLLPTVAYSTTPEQRDIEELKTQLETEPIGGGTKPVRVSGTPSAVPPAGTVVVDPLPGGTTEVTTGKPTDKTSEVAVSEFPKTGTVSRASVLNVRDAPWGTVIGSLGDGDAVNILAKAGSWYKISYQGGDGYIHASYVDTDKIKADAFTGWVKGNTAVLAGPDGEKLGDLAKGFKIEEVLKRVGDYYEIKYQGRLGFVKASAITTDPVQPDPPPKPPANPIDSASPPVSGNMDPRAPGVITWAKAQLGRTDYKGYCQRFVHHAYGKSYGYASAKACYNDIGRKDTIANLSKVPIGSLVFFDSHPQYGHVGIYIGNGQVIHGVSTVRIETMTTGWLARDYQGWAPAPSSWPGR